jgi:hypothetical protein
MARAVQVQQSGVREPLFRAFPIELWPKRTSGKVADWFRRVRSGEHTRPACAPRKPGHAYDNRRKLAQTAGYNFLKTALETLA